MFQKLREWLAKMARGKDRSLWWNDAHGRYRVRYPDGELSQRFCYDVAQSYRAIFGGEIIEASNPNPRGTHATDTR